MRTAALVCNFALCCTVALIILTEGIPSVTVYALFTLLALGVPAITLAAIAGRATGRAPIKWMTALLNVILFGVTCWSLVAQYPPPEGYAVLIFALLMLAAPLLSLAVIFAATTSVREIPQM